MRCTADIGMWRQQLAVLRERTSLLRLHLWTRLRSAVRANEIALPLLAVAIGVIVGLGVVALRWALQIMHELLFALPSGQRLSASM